MGKKKRKQRNKAGAEMGAGAGGSSGGAMAFSFGDPEPALGAHVFDYIGVDLLDNGRYYDPPVSLSGLARLRRANVYHGPLLAFKTNMVMRGFAPSDAVTRQAMKAFVADYNIFANAYFQKIYNHYGEVVRLEHLAAINMRRMKEPDCYGVLTIRGEIVEFEPGEVLHVKNYDVEQSIYGIPEYLGAIQSMLLNEDATLFRRRYYKNGAHMGYVFYSSEAALSDEDQQAVKKAIEGAKGLGNFRNMFIHIPDGREKGIQILPVGDFSTRDDLEKIKNLSRDDIIAAHRVPPGLANLVPVNTYGFGDIIKTDAVYEKNEVTPIRQDLLTINEALPEGLKIRFELDNKEAVSGEGVE